MTDFLILFLVGAVASAINAVAGGGSLISFPSLHLGFHLSEKVANMTNTVSLWPGSLAGAIGFLNVLKPLGRYFRLFILPTLLGAALGAWMLIQTKDALFRSVVPWLLFLAAALLLFQLKIKEFIGRGGRKLSPVLAVILQFAVSIYGGYFGAGMGIMMLAVFTLVMDGTIHEINAVKNWLGLFINFVATLVFFGKGAIEMQTVFALSSGAIVGGFFAAKYSQKVNSDILRLTIAGYGFLAAGYFAYQSWW